MRAERLPAVIPFPSGGAPRTPGVHVSGLIRALAVEYGILDKKWVPEDFELQDISEDGTEQGEWWAGLDQDSQIRMAIGMAWEAWYLPRIPSISHQPGECCVDGVYLTVDGESRDLLLSEYDRKSGVTQVVHEVKTTSKSINTVGDLMQPNPKNWMWLTQTKAYAKARGTRVIYLHILYIFGDYSYPMKPQLHLWRLEFDQSEIDDAWSLLLDSLTRYKRQGRVNLPLAPSRLQLALLASRRRLRQPDSSSPTKPGNQGGGSVAL